MDADLPDRDPRDLAARRVPLQDAAARARALLEATNAFLVCDDIDAVARSIAIAIEGMFRPDKTAVTIAEPDGSVRLAYTKGYSGAEREAIDDLLSAGSTITRRVLDGEAMWSDEPGREQLRRRIAAFGGVDGFSLAIAGPMGVVGTCSALYVEPHSFDDAFRSAAVGLAAQAGLSLSLIASRDDVRRAAAEAARRQRASQAMLRVAADLAPVTDPLAIPGILVSAIRFAAGARSSIVARRLADGSGFRVLGTSGLSAEQAPVFDGRVLSVTAGGAMGRLLAGEAAVSRTESSGLHVASGIGLSVNAPIVVGPEVWGFIGLGDPEDAADELELIELVSGFATIAATAIARADAVNEVDRQRRRSETLLELSSILAGVDDRDRIAAVVCGFIRRASDAPFAMVARRVPAAEAFEIVATEGLDADQIARIEEALARPDRPSLRELLAGSVTMRSGESAVGPGMGIGRASGAPIVIDGRSEGFIAIGTPPDSDVTATDWISLLMAFAALTATAIARADAVAALAAQRDVLASEVDERTRSLRTAIDELRVASEAKSDFLANVSHELRTPLTAILGFAELLATGFDGDLSDAQQRDVDSIHTSSRHLLSLIDDLIDISSIEAGRIQLAIEAVDPVELVRESVATMRPIAAARGISVEVDRRIAPVKVAADRARLREIVLNLVSNAVKFSPPGGLVQIGFEIHPAEPGTGSGSSTLAISVRDSGPGVPPADRARIFEKFTRLADPAIAGTGLGLAISRDLARLHGGDVTIDSSTDRGSTFTIRLPLASTG